MRRLFSYVAPTLCGIATLSLAACGSHVLPGVADINEGPAEQRLAVQPWLPKAQLLADKVRAGDAFDVSCPPLATDDGAPAQVLLPSVEPAVRRVRSDGTHHTYVAEKAGTYEVRCTSPDHHARGEASAVTVEPAPPQFVALRLEPTELQAGERAVAACEGIDAYGNAVVPPGASLRVSGNEAAAPAAIATGGTLTAARFFSSQPMGMRAQDGRTMQVRPKLAGAVTLRCSVNAWPQLGESAPVTLQVRPAGAAQVEAVLGDAPLRAHVPVPVRCVVRDAAGNEVHGLHAVATAEGPGPVTVTENGVSATVAGTYAVRCALPPGPGHDAELRSAPVSATVAPGPAVGWQVSLHRPGRCFSQRQRLPLAYRAWDAYGNPVRDVPVRLEVQPPTHVERDASGGFVLAQEGSYDVTLRALGEAAANLAPFSDHVVVDTSPPHIELLSPARGAMVESSDGVQMLVGRVVDPVSALVSFSIDGVAQTVTPGAQAHEFAVPFNSPWGLSVVRATAEDACGNVASLRQSFLRSAAFGPATDAADPAARVTHAARAATAQPLWDDGDPTGGHDISNLLQRMMAGGGLDERLPEQLAAISLAGTKTQLDDVTRKCLLWTSHHKEPGIEVVRTGKLRMAAPAIEFLHVEEGGVHMAVRFADLYLPLAAHAHLSTPCGPHFNPTVKATLHAESLRIELRARVSMQGDAVKVEMCPSCAHAEFVGSAPKLLFDDPEHPGSAGILMHPSVANLALRAVSRSLQAALENRVREDVVREAERLLHNLHIDHALPLPTPLKSSASVLSGVDGITLRGGAQGGGTSEVSLYTQVTAPLPDERERQREAPVPLAPLRGPIRQEAGAPLSLELSDSETFAIAVRDDTLNQMLWSLWASGAFNGVDPRKFTQQESSRESNLLDAASLKLYFTSPPVVMPAERAGEVRLGVGDVYAEVDVDTYAIFGAMAPLGRQRLSAKFYFSMLMGAKLGVDPARRTLRVDPVGPAQVDLQVTDIASPAMHAAVTHWLGKMINKSMPSLLTQPLVAFPLTKLQIGRLPGIPNDAVWTLDTAELVRPAGAQEFIMRGHLSTLPQAFFDDVDAAQAQGREGP